MSYLKETVAEYGIDKHIRYRHKVARGRLVRRRQPMDPAG